MRPSRVLQSSLALISCCHALFDNTIFDSILLSPKPSIESHKRAGVQCGPAANGASCGQGLCCSPAVCLIKRGQKILELKWKHCGATKLSEGTSNNSGITQ